MKRRIISEEPKPPKNKPAVNTRKEMEAAFGQISERCIALENELTVQHQRSNNAVRALGATFRFLQQFIGSYMEVAQHYKEQNKPVPAIWMANRILDHYGMLFTDDAFTAQQLAPPPEMLRWMFQIAGRQPEVGTPMFKYINPPAPMHPGASPETKEKPRGKKAQKKR